MSSASRTHPIQCVAFDAVGTLIRPEPAAVEIYYRVAHGHGSQLTAAEVEQRYREAFRETEREVGEGAPGGPFATSERQERERWRTIVARVIDDVRDPEACYRELFAHFARPDAWRLLDDAPEILSELRRRGIRLALASNFDRRLHLICDALPALRGIDCRVISSEVGYRKPSRQFFEALLKSAGCRPDELLMVGDDLEYDVEGARRLGISAILVARPGLPGVNGVSRLTELTNWL